MRPTAGEASAGSPSAASSAGVPTAADSAASAARPAAAGAWPVPGAVPRMSARSWPDRGQVIKQAAERLFGPGTRPAAILLTHTHGDHAGSALELARSWDLPVYVHPGELPLAAGKYLPEYGDPISRWLIEPLMRLMPRRAARMAAKASITEAARAFNPEAGVPGLPDWACIPTPGHTPGHVCFFRPSDRVLVTGDAVLTLNFNSLRDLLRWRQRVSGPPWISTWNWPAAKQSVAALARLEPQVLAPGHRTPMATATAAKLRALAENLNARPGQRKQLPGIRARAEGRRAHGSVNRLAGAGKPASPADRCAPLPGLPIIS